jgi:DNA helicase-2/ATP-dependent DNA helicase PcrA
MENIIKGLNSKQKEAVQTINGPVLILAGPGSGKTRVLTHRLAYLISQKILSDNILAVTFTNKAAEEMKQRTKKLISPTCQNSKNIPLIATFHSFCLKVLRKEIDMLGYKKDFTIYDEKDKLKILKKTIKQLGINAEQFQHKKIAIIISSLKSEIIDSEKYKETADEYFEKNISKIYSVYQKRMKQNNALDFDDLIMLCVQVFQKFPEILEKYQNKFKYILVDEYQDTDPAQYKLIKMLTEKNKNICVVGDDAQSIYSFRNADFRNILNFEKDFPKAKVITLDQNYRSTQNILDAASTIISKNKFQKPKKLWTENPAGPPISIVDTCNEKHEAGVIIQKIKELKKQGFELNDFTVFYRTNAQSRSLEEALIHENIPYKIIGGTKFYQRKEIKDIIAYLKFINSNDLISLERILNTPNRGIGKITNSNIINKGLKATSKTNEKVKGFCNLIKKAKNIALQKPLSEVLKFILKETKYRNYLKKKYSNNIIKENIPEDEIRWENIKELIKVSSDYDILKPPQGLKDFLEKTALFSEADEIQEQQKVVYLMTLHTAKGLEFPVVFIIGCEEGILPHSRSILNPLDIEEERRLFYVGITRSKKHVFLVFSQTRSSWKTIEANSPSRFLAEIPENLIKFEQGISEINDIIDF